MNPLRAQQGFDSAFAELDALLDPEEWKLESDRIPSASFSQASLASLGGEEGAGVSLPFSSQQQPVDAGPGTSPSSFSAPSSIGGKQHHQIVRSASAAAELRVDSPVPKRAQPAIASDLLDQDWYVGSMPREDSEELLRSTGASCFILRDSSRVGCFAASMFDVVSGAFVHALIEPVIGGFCFETDLTRHAVFPTVSLLVEFSTTTASGQLAGLAPVNAKAYSANFLQNCYARRLPPTPAGSMNFNLRRSESMAPTAVPVSKTANGDTADVDRNSLSRVRDDSLLKTLAHLHLPLLNCTKTVVIEEGDTAEMFRERMWKKYYLPKLVGMSGDAVTTGSTAYALQVTGSDLEYLDEVSRTSTRTLKEKLGLAADSQQKPKLALVERKTKPHPLSEFSWFSTAQSREAAEQLLHSTSVNCFVIRESSQEGCYALSKYSRLTNQFVHYLITPVESPSEFEPGYCFDAQPQQIYKSVPRLVRECGELVDFVSIGDVHRRARIADELWRTECDYLTGLMILVNGYANPMLEQGIASQAEVADIFANLSQILDLHSTLRAKLEQRAAISDPQHLLIGDVFLDIGENFKIYAEFATNFERGMATVKRKSETDARFRKFMESVRSETRSALDFMSYYIMPIQRLPRYELMLNDMLKATWAGHTDFPAVQSAVQAVKRAAAFVNDTKAERMSTEKLEEVQQHIGRRNNSVSGESLVRPGRLFVREGPLELVRAHGKPAPKYVFLFSDMLLVTSAKMDKRGTLKKIADDFRIKIKSASLARISTKILVVTDEVGDDVTLQAETPHDAASWAADIERTIAKYQAAHEELLESVVPAGTS